MNCVAIAIIVNTAIDFVRTLEDDLKRRFSIKKDYESIIMIFYAAQCIHREHDSSHRQRADDLFNLAIYDLLKNIMMSTYSTLFNLQDVLQFEFVSQYKFDHFDFRDKRSH